MELATVHLKLSGDPQNTIFLEKVTPARLAVLAFMHGEDCVQSLKVTKVAKDMDDADVMAEINEIFRTENAQKAVKTLFPGLGAAVPRTFKSIGYHADQLVEEPNVVRHDPHTAGAAAAKSAAAAAAIQRRIKAANADRANGEMPALASAAAAVPVTQDELEDQFDNTGGDLDDDPLDLEMAGLEDAGSGVEGAQ